VEKTLADHAYKTTFMKWVEENIAGLEVEISLAPPSSKGFVPLKWRWVTERTFGIFNFFSRLDEDYEKTAESQESRILWQNFLLILKRISK